VAEELDTRADLLVPYEHPYRHWLPRIWEIAHLRRTSIAGGAVAGACGTAWLVTGGAGWGILAVVVAMILLLVTAVWTAGAAAIVARHVRAWDRPGELERVRAGRPHAADRDPTLVHDEYAVTVEETGDLFLWRFETLRVDQPAPRGTVDVPGRPRHAASVIHEWDFDHEDTVRAAEQLADAQAHAAAQERTARDEAERRAAARVARRARDADTAAAAATLRHLTGQAPRSD